MADVEQEWGWGRQLAVGLRAQDQSLQGQAVGGQEQHRGGEPGVLGAATGLSTKVRLTKAMALVLPAAAMGSAAWSPSSIGAHFRAEIRQG